MSGTALRRSRCASGRRASRSRPASRRRKRRETTRQARSTPGRSTRRSARRGPAARAPTSSSQMSRTVSAVISRNVTTRRRRRDSRHRVPLFARDRVVSAADRGGREVLGRDRFERGRRDAEHRGERCRQTLSTCIDARLSRRHQLDRQTVRARAPAAGQRRPEPDDRPHVPGRLGHPGDELAQRVDLRPAQLVALADRRVVVDARARSSARRRRRKPAGTSLAARRGRPPASTARASRTGSGRRLRDRRSRYGRKTVQSRSDASTSACASPLLRRYRLGASAVRAERAHVHEPAHARRAGTRRSRFARVRRARARTSARRSRAGCRRD